jgi:hypothetical protein
MYSLNVCGLFYQLSEPKRHLLLSIDLLFLRRSNGALVLPEKVTSEDISHGGLLLLFAKVFILEPIGCDLLGRWFP